MILRSRIFLANSRIIITDAGIVTEGGFISDIGKYETVKIRNVGAQTLDFDGIICPALINAHTHLELSPFKSIAHKDFVDWVLHLVAERFSRQYEDLSTECAKAKYEAEKSGTSYFINVGNDFELNRQLGGNQNFQFEQIGINEKNAGGVFDRALSLVSGRSNFPISLAIHAPYSTSASLMKKVKTFNNERGTITSIHLAETEDEVEFVRSRTGRMADLLNSRVGEGKWSFRATGKSPVEYVDSLGILDEKTLCVHCVFVDNRDLEILRRRKCGVVICARSNRNLTGRIPNVSKFLQNGIKILLGTDSRASSTDLDMFAEMSAFYREFHGSLDPSRVFQMATTGAAEFLGISDPYGQISVGKTSAAVYVPFKGRTADAFEFLVTDAKGKAEAISN